MLALQKILKHIQEGTVLIIDLGHGQVHLFPFGDHFRFLLADGTIELRSFSCNPHIPVGIWTYQIQIKTGIFLSRGRVLRSWLWIHMDTWISACKNTF